MKSIFKSIIAILVLLSFSGIAYAQKDIPDDFCISDDEYRLYELINAHRLINGLKEIPLSASLSYVAKTHVIDLYTNHPDTSICNLNSWSDKGDWTSCCHNKYVPAVSCIRDKPKELTKYTGEGYELTYAEVFDTHPDSVFKFWKKIDQANDFLLSQGSWDKKSWRAMGVGIYKSYAVLWMGLRTDAAPKPVLCSGIVKEDVKPDRPVEAAANAAVTTNSTGRFYVVIASFQSEADAAREAKKHEGITGAKVSIIKNSQGQFRVCINDYPSLEAAKQGKEKYKADFNGAWILNY